MRETPINHKVSYTHNQFDTQKSFDARTAKLNDNTSYQTSFDNYYNAIEYVEKRFKDFIS